MFTLTPRLTHWSLESLAHRLTRIRSENPFMIDRESWSLGSDNNVWLHAGGAPGTFRINNRTFDTPQFIAFMAFVAFEIGEVTSPVPEVMEKLRPYIVPRKW